MHKMCIRLPAERRIGPFVAGIHVDCKVNVDRTVSGRKQGKSRLAFVTRLLKKGRPISVGENSLVAETAIKDLKKRSGDIVPLVHICECG